MAKKLPNDEVSAEELPTSELYYQLIKRLHDNWKYQIKFQVFPLKYSNRTKCGWLKIKSEM